VLFFKTLILLSNLKPEVVYAQNPPVFCPLTCLLYCRTTRTRLVIDHHSIWRVKTLGGSPVSRLLGFLEGVVARAASANTAPHEFWAAQLRKMGARRVEVIHDFVSPNPNRRDEALRVEFTEQPLVAISSHGGHPMERIESEAAAVGSVDGVGLLITGPPSKLAGRLSHYPMPPSVKYLGFLPRQTYESLKASADMAVNITDEPYTLSHVLLEYAASSLPIISSRQDVLDDFFGDALLYTDSSEPKEVAEKVKSFKDEAVRAEYKERVVRWYDALKASRPEEVRTLRSLLGS
jgi:glycosyltransferase involved in cell wall biosynthesis